MQNLYMELSLGGNQDFRLKAPPAPLLFKD